jgi:2-heptyl-1-hydroxyquinolin-4(1H)-one methyltransferase
MAEKARTGRGISRRHRESWAATYAETPYEELPWFHPDPSVQVVQAVEEGFLPPRVPVLDIGCGAGSNVLYLASKGFESHGIDISPGAIRAAHERAARAGLHPDLRVGDALNLEFFDRHFGGLLDNGCFHTLPIGRRKDYAREAARVLRPGGGFVLSWVAREHTAPRGPPHRPSLEEVARVFEKEFLFERTRFRPARDGEGPAVYVAWLRRREVPQPPPR